MITTIQLNESVKKQLNQLKEDEKQTYEVVIVKMIKELEMQKRKNKDLLKEGYQEMQQESKRINKEWSSIDNLWD